MRHSTSEWNVRLRKFKKDNNIDIIDLKWKHPHSFKTTYDKPEQIDAALSEDGVAQCEAQRADFQEKYPNIKYILCSPFRRTVQTLNYMMKDYKNPLDPGLIVMFPEIVEEVETVGDLAFETANLMQKYKKDYNWFFYDKAFYENPEIWFLHNINESTGKNKLKHEQIKNWKKYGDKEKLIKYWQDSNRELTDPTISRSKAEHAKIKVMEFIEANEVKDDELLIISHFNFLNYFTSKSFNEKNEPSEYRFIKNLEVIKTEV